MKVYDFKGPFMTDVFPWYVIFLMYACVNTKETEFKVKFLKPNINSNLKYHPL